MSITIRFLCTAILLLAASASVSHAQTGACCNGGYTCTVDTQARCQLYQGTYQGAGTSCTPANPCLPAFGACCIAPASSPSGNGPQFPAPGSCAPATTATCTSYAGIYQGNNTSCSPSPCPQAAPTTGACCSLDASQHVYCHLETASVCAASYSVFTAVGTACSAAACPQPALGACCRIISGTNTCFSISLALCQVAGGTYNGDSSVCAAATCPQPVLGTCCYAATSTSSSRCVVVRSDLCVGTGTTFSSATTACATSPCVRSCPCDYNFDGLLNTLDLVQFTNNYLAGNGDFDHNGVTDVNDYNAFVACYYDTSTVGCFRAAFSVASAPPPPPPPPCCSPISCGREIPLAVLLLVAIAPAAWTLIRRRH